MVGVRTGQEDRMEMPGGIFYHVKAKNTGYPDSVSIPELENLYMYHPKDLPGLDVGTRPVN